MTGKVSESLVLVYSTPVEFEAELMKAMLSSAGIPSVVENSNGPFPGLSATPVDLFVAAEYESLARQLIQHQESKHRERLTREEKDLR